MVRRRRGFSVIELLVVMGIIAILIAILVPVISRARQSKRTVECLNNLRSIGAAFNAYAVEHQSRLPDPETTEQSWEQLLTPYSGDHFHCPADFELYPVVGSSYDWRDTGKESTTMAGKSIADVRRGNVVLAMDALPGWHAKSKINALRLDGSVETMDQQACFRDLATPVRAGN
jgi:prepilin-type N-terminal cleavage/methylation domain-containing protein